MTELYYIPISIACFLASREMGMKTQMYFLENLFEEERGFIHPFYWDKKRQFISEALRHTVYLIDSNTIDKEFPAIQKDFLKTGRMLDREDFLSSEYADLDLFFMFMRLNILYSGSQDYMRKKMRTIINAYGYKRRAAQIMLHIRDCMMFYHIQPYLSEKHECDIRNVSLDNMIIFRII